MAKLITKELDKCYDWWESLTEEKQFDIMRVWYPTDVGKDTDINKLFGDMADHYQLEIYRGESKSDTKPNSLPLEEYDYRRGK